MTDAHTPCVLSDADAAADLAGVPRPDRGAPKYASEANTEELLLTSKQPDALHLADALEKSMQYPLHGKAADMLRALVSERDALAGRLRELESALGDARTNMMDWASYASPYFQEKHNLAGDIAAIDAALCASKEQPRPSAQIAKIMALVERYSFLREHGTSAEYDKAGSAVEAALRDAPQQAEPLFAEMIAQHPGLREEIEADAVEAQAEYATAGGGFPGDHNGLKAAEKYRASKGKP